MPSAFWKYHSVFLKTHTKRTRDRLHKPHIRLSIPFQTSPKFSDFLLMEIWLTLDLQRSMDMLKVNFLYHGLGFLLSYIVHGLIDKLVLLPRSAHLCLFTAYAVREIEKVGFFIFICTGRLTLLRLAVERLMRKFRLIKNSLPTKQFIIRKSRLIN